MPARRNKTASPTDSLAAHRSLDAAVDRCYGTKKFRSDADRLKLLFGMYQKFNAAA